MNKNRWMIFANHGLIRLSQPPVEPSNPPVPTPPVNPPAPTDPPRTFTQEELSAIATAQKDRGEREGKKQAEAEWLARLGVSSVEEVDSLAALAKAAKDADEANKTEAQKLLEAAKAERAASAAERAEAKADRHAAALERALTAAGMPVDTQAFVNVPGVTVESTTEEVTAAIEAMKTAQPALFTAVVPPPVPNGDPRPPAGGRQPKGTFGQEGKGRFEREQARLNPQPAS